MGASQAPKRKLPQMGFTVFLKGDLSKLTKKGPQQGPIKGGFARPSKGDFLGVYTKYVNCHW